MSEEKNSEKTKEVAVVESQGGAVVEAGADDFLLADAGSGGENIGMEHTTVPFLSILQQLSPEVQKGGPEYIKGAEAGMIMNTLTKEVFPANISEDGHNGILVVAVHFDPKAIEWKPRGQGGGGGLVKVWGDDKSYQNNPNYQFDKEKNRWISKEGNEIMDHYDTYVLQLGSFDSTNEFQPALAQAIVSCKGSQIKKARAWNSERKLRMISVGGKMINPPHWYQTYRITTRFEQNDKGSWFGYEFKPHTTILDMPNGRDLYNMAKSMYEAIQGGIIKADDKGYAAEAESTGTTGDIPF